MVDYDMLLEENKIKQDDIFQDLFDDGKRNRPKLVQWGPHDGQESLSIVSVVLQHHEEVAPMKIVFGTITVETAQQQSTDHSSVWITLAAPVPPLQDTRSETNQVQLSLCLFDCADPDIAVDTWDIGKFTYVDLPEGISKRSDPRSPQSFLYMICLLSDTYLFFPIR
jgi:hypothetical protein